MIAYVGMALTHPLALKGVTHVIIVVCYHPHLVSMLFATSIPTSFNILLKMFYSCMYVHYPEATVAVRSWGGEIHMRAIQ